MPEISAGYSYHLLHAQLIALNLMQGITIMHLFYLVYTLNF